MFFDLERDADGYPKLSLPAPDRPPTRRKLFERMCYLNGVTDPQTVAGLWAEELARRPDPKPERRRAE